jgi:hypothetical protein
MSGVQDSIPGSDEGALMVLPGHSVMDVQGRPQGELITPDQTTDARRTC